MLHTEMNIWKIAMELTKDIYLATSDFPKDEKFGLVSQMRKAAVSVPSNIAEGAGRRSHPQYRSFLNKALGSLAELETQLLISGDLGYLKTDTSNEPLNKLHRVRYMLRRVIEVMS